MARVEITLPEAGGAREDGTLYDALKEVIGRAEGLSPDFAAEHKFRALLA